MNEDNMNDIPILSIALFEPQIPPNTGNISRLCVGLDIPLMLVGKMGFDIDDKHVRRAGLDYWSNLKLERYETMEEFLSATANRRKILATTKGARPYYKFVYQPGDILLFGAETHGLPLDYIRQNMDTAVTIPMPGQVRSLNLSNSAAIMAYHALIQLDYFGDYDVNRNYYEIFGGEGRFFGDK